MDIRNRNETVNRDGNQTALKLPSTLNRDVNQTILQSHSCWWILSKWIEVILHASCSISRQNLNDILAWCFKWYTTFLKLGLKLFLYEDILWIIICRAVELKLFYSLKFMDLYAGIFTVLDHQCNMLRHLPLWRYFLILVLLLISRLSNFPSLKRRLSNFPSLKRLRSSCYSLYLTFVNWLICFWWVLFPFPNYEKIASLVLFYIFMVQNS